MVIGYMVFSGYMVNFWVVPISLSTIKLTIYPEFDLNFGYMVNFFPVPRWTIYPGASVLFSKITQFTNWGILENSTVKITPVGDKTGAS